MPYRFSDDEGEAPALSYTSPLYRVLAASLTGPDATDRVPSTMAWGDPTAPFGLIHATAASRRAADSGFGDAVSALLAQARGSAPMDAAPDAAALGALRRALLANPEGVDVAQAPTPMPTRPVNPAYPSAETLANIIYNETGSLRQHPSGPSLENLHSTMAHALLNRIDQRTIGWVARKDLSPEARTAIFKNRVPDAVSAYDSALAAARAALGRDGALSQGRDSTVFYNNRPNGDTSPNTSQSPPWPFVATFGPYRNDSPTKDAPADSTYFAFFREPD